MPYHFRRCECGHAPDEHDDDNFWDEPCLACDCPGYIEEDRR